jgi:hypothetical protein
MALVTLFSGAAMAQPGPDGACGFRRADANNDGKVTFAEHEAFLRSRFATNDQNKDGVLSGDELNRDKSSRTKRLWMLLLVLPRNSDASWPMNSG